MCVCARIAGTHRVGIAAAACSKDTELTKKNCCFGEDDCCPRRTEPHTNPPDPRTQDQGRHPRRRINSQEFCNFLKTKQLQNRENRQI